MRFRRRRETLNERLLREGGLEQAPLEWEPRHAGLPLAGDVGALDSAGITGLHRAREWDATAAVEARELRGEEVEFVVLPDGSVLVDEEEGDVPLAPLADALEEQLRPPYRARGVRRRGDVWAVAAKAIEVVELRPDVDGDELELISRSGERSLTLDGARSFGSVPQLEELASRRAADYVVRASRLDGSLWEVRVTPL
ncbi:MAG TPA: hypothetical protein VE596_10545 [Gaiellaceae bacterium]|nr:hypothetical protein [Gaiellaceae bacterium]